MRTQTSIGGSTAQLLLSGSLALLCSCAEPAELVPIFGCGVEASSTLEVAIRGDFPPTGKTRYTLGRGDSVELRPPADATAVTLRAAFGNSSTAVGRTTHLSDASVLPVYFAVPNSLCAVPAGPRQLEQAAAVAIDESGHVLIAGGRDEIGQLSGEVLEFFDDDLQPRIQAVTGSLPLPRIGHTLHGMHDGWFWIVGGAAQESLQPLVGVRTSDGTLQTRVLEAAFDARAWHGAAAVSSTRIVVAGGCSATDAAGRCQRGAANVLDTVQELEAEGGERVRVRELPRLNLARYAADLHRSRDGLLFVVGGFDVDGATVHAIERLRPRAEQWEILPQTFAAPCLGSALLDDGILTCAVAGPDGPDDGTAPDVLFRWISESFSGEYVPHVSTQTNGSALRHAESRPLMVTAGEQVLAETWLVPLMHVAPSAAGLPVEDLGRRLLTQPVASRTGARLVALRDRSILLVGGSHEGETPATPFALRFRPELDGDDDDIPNLDVLDSGSLLTSNPSQVIADALTLSLLAEAADHTYPQTRIHVRGFRSHAFRMQARLQVEASVTPWFVFGQGASRGLALALFDGGTQLIERTSSGSHVVHTCAPDRVPELDGTTRIWVDVAPGLIELGVGDDRLTRCAVEINHPVSAGIGVTGNGSLHISDLALERQ